MDELENIETIIKRQAIKLIKDESIIYIEQIIKEILSIVKMDIIINRIINPEYEIDISQIDELIIMQYTLQQSN